MVRGIPSLKFPVSRSNQKFQLKQGETERANNLKMAMKEPMNIFQAVPQFILPELIKRRNEGLCFKCGQEHNLLVS
jgi:hypothetical protein